MKNKDFFVHEEALVESLSIGKGTRIWEFSHVCDGVTIGSSCNICSFCFIEKGVLIGNDVTVKCGIYLWDGITIEDNVFLGPNVVFTNDVRPRSKQYKAPEKTIVKHGASIGANTTILAGVTIGKFAMTGIASVVTRNVPDYALVYGNPAKQHGWVDEFGEKLKQIEPLLWEDTNGDLYLEQDGRISRK